MSNAPKISIVLGTFNQKAVLKRVLDQYQHQSIDPNNFELIVVDSSSSDGTKELLESHKPNHGFVPIIQKNSGKAAARNNGVKSARGTYIIITDADMIPDTKFVETHLRAQESTTSPTCFEGVTYDMTHLHWPPEKSAIYPYIKKDYKDGAKLGWYYFLTGNISFPKSIFKAENGFSTEFLGYGWEDLELGYRFSKKKIPLYYLKDAKNYHYHVITDEDEIERNVKKGESAKIFLKKHPELKWFLGLNPFSKWIKPKIKKEGKFYQFIETKCFQSKNKALHGFGHWFLKEYHYLDGILD